MRWLPRVADGDGELLLSSKDVVCRHCLKIPLSPLFIYLFKTITLREVGWPYLGKSTAATEQR